MSTLWLESGQKGSRELAENELPEAWKGSGKEEWAHCPLGVEAFLGAHVSKPLSPRRASGKLPFFEKRKLIDFAALPCFLEDPRLQFSYFFKEREYHLCGKDPTGGMMTVYDMPK